MADLKGNNMSVKETNNLLKEFKDEIISLHLNENKNIVEIKEILGFKYDQPIYNLLKRLGIFRKSVCHYEKVRKYHVNENFFDNIDTQEKAYILRFYCC